MRKIVILTKADEKYYVQLTSIVRQDMDILELQNGTHPDVDVRIAAFG